MVSSHHFPTPSRHSDSSDLSITETLHTLCEIVAGLHVEGGAWPSTTVLCRAPPATRPKPQGLRFPGSLHLGRGHVTGSIQRHVPPALYQFIFQVPSGVEDPLTPFCHELSEAWNAARNVVTWGPPRPAPAVWASGGLPHQEPCPCRPMCTGLSWSYQAAAGPSPRPAAGPLTPGAPPMGQGGGARPCVAPSALGAGLSHWFWPQTFLVTSSDRTGSNLLCPPGERSLLGTGQNLHPTPSEATPVPMRPLKGMLRPPNGRRRKCLTSFRTLPFSKSGVGDSHFLWNNFEIL